MKKTDFMTRREFGFGRLQKTGAPGPHPVETGGMPMPQTPPVGWVANPSAVRVSPSVSTEGAQPGMSRSNPDPQPERSWGEYLAHCLRVLCGD